MNWHSKRIKDIIEILQTNINYGLTKTQVEYIQKQYGKNCLKEKKKKSLFVKFIMQFNDFMIFILFIAALVSFIISCIGGDKNFLDPLIIIFIIILNALLGFLQENKAEKSLESLKKLSSPTSKVLRDGNIKIIKSEEIVPGDIMILETGDNVSADGRIITSSNLKVEESNLTGESVDIEKDHNANVKEEAVLGDRINMVFSGSSITYGRGKAIVIATGMDTEVGKIADIILKDNNNETPLQKKLEKTGKTLGISALIICIVIFILGILKNFSPFSMFMTSVSLAVAAIPEGLPAIVTIVLAIGVQKMVKRNVIIRKLPAVETLGSTNIICSDKTGTLTENKMKVVEIYDESGIINKENINYRKILTYSCLCNNVSLQIKDEKEILQGDSTEVSIVKGALDINIDKIKLDKEYKRIMEIPFDSKRKLMTTLHKNTNNKYFSITKGALDILLEKSIYYYENGKTVKLNYMKKREILNYNNKMAEKGLRVLAVGFKNYGNMPFNIKQNILEEDIIFLGLIGIIDPPRKEAKEAIKICKEAGIKTIMITGDHIVTAKAIASKLGILENNSKSITGEELSKLSDSDLYEIIDDYTVFARVSPEHKLKIVQTLQKKGNVVAMTGDGINDAPALKYADIGCAMGITGTDVTKSAADMILIDDNFSTIVEAVKEGRTIYCNIKKTLHFLLSSNIGEIVTIFTAILLGWPSPLLAAHLLWVNLVTDSLPAIALGVDNTEEDIMKQKPYNKNKNLLSNSLWTKIIFQGLMIGFLSLISFLIGTIYFDEQGSNLIGRTMAFSTLSISQLMHVLNVRTEKSIFSISIFDNIYLILSILIGIFLQVFVVVIPIFNKAFKVSSLNLYQWLVVIVLSLLPIVIVEIEKFFTFRNKNKKYYEVLEK